MEYPEGASGDAQVILELVVGAGGEVRDARIVEGAEPFSAAALTVARQWRFEPARRGTAAVAARIRFQLRFREPERVPEPQPAAAPEPLAQTLTCAEVRQLQGAFGERARSRSRAMSCGVSGSCDCLTWAPFADGRGHVLLGGRYSYTAYLSSLLGEDVRLEYWDYQARASYRVGAHDTLGVFVFGSFDYFGEETSDPDDDLFSTELRSGLSRSGDRARDDSEPVV